MTTNLIPLLTLFDRLAEAAPGVTKTMVWGIPAYTINEYTFWIDGRNNLTASYDGMVVTGRPALDWLVGALQAECERRRWYVATRTAYLGKHVAEVYNQSACRDTLAAAMLTALVEAVEAERVR